jgi:alpha-tubulin suppressor-like RCC1 family protein
MAVQAVGVTGISQVAAGDYHTVALESNGAVQAWGNNAEGQLGDGTLTNRLEAVTMPGVSGVQNISAGTERTMFVTVSGSVYGLGDNTYGELGNDTVGFSDAPGSVSGITNPKQVSGGSGHSLVLESNGTVWAFGQNLYGQLGNNGTNNVDTPAQVTDGAGVLQNITAISAGSNFNLALTSSGNVRSWGQNNYGQIGDNTTTQRNQPVYVLTSGGTLSNITAVSAGADHSLALASNGSVWAWGYNAYGQLGNNTLTEEKEPVQVLTATGTLTGVTAISAGYYHSLALTSSGTVYAWGENNDGQLGTGTTTNSSVAVPISMSGTTIKAIAAGDAFSVALTSSNTLVAWGTNGNGQLGDGATTQSNVPVAVHTLTSVSTFAVGEAFGVAVTSSGTVWAWGSNSVGQMGTNGTLGQFTTPVQLTGVTGATSGTPVGCGSFQSLLINSTLSLSDWGDAVWGQLGDGAFGYYTSPSQTTGLQLVGY